MKIITPATIAFIIILSFTTSQSIAQKNEDTKNLYAEIVALDSIFFHAYNTCNLKIQAAFYSDSIEFYHDKGGFSTSKKDLLAATEKNICGKVTRELIKGSIEVSPIPGYGAVEIGEHRFHNNQEPEANQRQTGSKFVIIWHQLKDRWEIARVISLH